MNEIDIKFLQLNVQGGLGFKDERHTERIKKFLEEHRDLEVLCLQEIVEESAKYFSETFGFQYIYADMGRGIDDNESKGVAILSKLPIVNHEQIFLIHAPEDYKNKDQSFVCLIVDLEKGQEKFRFVTTHFPVEYPGEKVSDFQKETFAKLKEALGDKGEFVITGDFNSPRGTIIFDQLSELYTDNIPPEITTTIDPVLHRAGMLQYVVDGIFTTDNYIAKEVKVHEGLSDHKGITGVLKKKE